MFLNVKDKGFFKCLIDKLIEAINGIAPPNLTMVTPFREYCIKGEAGPTTATMYTVWDMDANVWLDPVWLDANGKPLATAPTILDDECECLKDVKCCPDEESAKKKAATKETDKVVSKETTREG